MFARARSAAAASKMLNYPDLSRVRLTEASPVLIARNDSAFRGEVRQNIFHITHVSCKS